MADTTGTRSTKSATESMNPMHYYPFITHVCSLRPDSVRQVTIDCFGTQLTTTSTAFYQQLLQEGVSRRAQILPEWWGLGGNATETPYIGLAELGVTLLIIGVLGYSMGKRLSLIPPRHRIQLLKAHELTMLAGVALTLPHFFTAEWEGTGLLVGILFAAEVSSGVYGRHLHRYAVRFGRKNEQSVLFSSIFDMTNRTVFKRWHKAHVWLTILTAIVLVMHIITSVSG